VQHLPHGRLISAPTYASEDGTFSPRVPATRNTLPQRTPGDGCPYEFYRHPSVGTPLPGCPAVRSSHPPPHSGKSVTACRREGRDLPLQVVWGIVRGRRGRRQRGHILPQRTPLPGCPAVRSSHPPPHSGESVTACRREGQDPPLRVGWGMVRGRRGLRQTGYTLPQRTPGDGCPYEFYRHPSVRTPLPGCPAVRISRPPPHSGESVTACRQEGRGPPLRVGWGMVRGRRGGRRIRGDLLPGA